MYANYASSVICEGQFWVVDNNTMSSGGWPSIILDGSTPVAFHSFCDVQGRWIPWEAGDLFIRTNGWPEGFGLVSATWAGIKTLFD
ncbi:MAG: hypothetical protein QUS11_04435 [Candidatus Fermentibacter sp.]|nr:hypothetical protein [Candidatus Fermentibacter sp.]